MAWLYQPLLPAAAELESTPPVSPISPAYWVGGSGTWDATDPTNWAATSGGAGGAGYPDSSSTVIFDSNSGSGTVTIDAAVCNDLTISGLSGAMTFAVAASSTLSIYGSISTPATNFSFSAGNVDSNVRFVATSGTKTITSNGATWNIATVFDGAGGTWQLQDNLTIGSSGYTGLQNGTLDLNGFIHSTGDFRGSTTNTRAINFGATGEIITNTTTSSTVWDLRNGTVTISGTNPIVRVRGSTNVTRIIQTSTGAEIRKISFALENTLGTISFSLVGEVNDLTVNNNAITVSITTLTIYGNFSVGGTSPTFSATNPVVFAATSGVKTITTNGEQLSFQTNFNGVGGTWQLQDNTSLSSTMTLTNGTIDLNGKTLTVTSIVTAAGTKNITFNGGTILSNLGDPDFYFPAFDNAAPTGFTTTAGTGTGKISLSSSSKKYFNGGDSVFNCTLENSGAGVLTIIGSNTFNDITNSVQPATFTFTAGTTTTVNEFTVAGTVGNIVTINSTGAAFTLSKASGTVNVSYCTISNSTATGGATWQAFTASGNTDGGGNTGWIFIGGIKIVIDSNVVLDAGILISF